MPRSSGSGYSARVERYLAKHPGATIAEARGHGKTPEHPGRGREEERYREYYEKRKGLEAQAQNQKRADFSHSDKWREDRSEKAMKKWPARLSDLERYVEVGIAGLMEDPDFDWVDERWAWLRYH